MHSAHHSATPLNHFLIKYSAGDKAVNEYSKKKCGSHVLLVLGKLPRIFVNTLQEIMTEAILHTLQLIPAQRTPEIEL